MKPYKKFGQIQVAEELVHFVEKEALIGLNLDKNQFWAKFENLIEILSPINNQLLSKRVHLQEQINQWYQDNRAFEPKAYQEFLTEIGYLEKRVADFHITTENVDEEIARQAGPQLVVPLDNARYAINAANARWGSLYDALYGTNVIDESEDTKRTTQYNPLRGKKVVEYTKLFLDKVIPLEQGSHSEAKQYQITAGTLSIALENGQVTKLKDPKKFIGYVGELDEPKTILCQNHQLHFEIKIDRHDEIGQFDQAGIKDIILESALTTIMDCEDSVAAVDTTDKVHIYRNWLGLMKGNLTSTFTKNGVQLLRQLNQDRHYRRGNGEEFSLSGRSLMFIRNVGHLMTSNLILDKVGQEVPEGIIDAVITSLIAKHSIMGLSELKNSKERSIYIVKPKMHGSEEVEFANRIFNMVEDMLEMERYTLKIGVMDEERRTSVNLINCIEKVKERIAFINTGFLDRTGDEIFTSMELGSVVPKAEMKQEKWLRAYERSNVKSGLKTGFQQRAQIGKGMWAMPDEMKAMLELKSDHPKSGANTAWVPSPTAATLHAIHYHQINVVDVQMKKREDNHSYLEEILTPPISKERAWDRQTIQNELDNNVQGILGYVVRWVHQGVGCSKVPDIHNVGLMEDRATLRISSQHIANWLHHQICTEEQVIDTFYRMAKVVDEQNRDDKTYRVLVHNGQRSNAFEAALELVLKGREQPNGYTEPILHRYRLKEKEEHLQKQSI
ncbi:malate synthase G [Alkalihalobacillus sp. 1P02AB]|uniref:malate synthase G n=1 Tax=Alkalihalobacillus sp. 1P02AB TaxID=3132260 RepID=UPI0039A70295